MATSRTVAAKERASTEHASTEPTPPAFFAQGVATVGLDFGKQYAYFTNPYRVRGPSLGLQASLGAVLSSGLAVGGMVAVTGASGAEPEAVSDSAGSGSSQGSGSTTKYGYSAFLGPTIVYESRPRSGYFAQLAVGYAWYRDVHISPTYSGPGGNLALGKNWSLGEQVSLTLALRLQVLRVSETHQLSGSSTAAGFQVSGESSSLGIITPGAVIGVTGG